MKITSTEAAVEHIKPARAAYAGQERLTFLRCRVTAADGISGDGVTGRFLADQVAHLLNGSISTGMQGLDPPDSEALAAQGS